MAGNIKLKHRKVLSSGQIAVLELLYKYRFGSVELLRKSLGLKTEPGIYRKLVILIDKGYVGKRYDKSYRIQGKPASYYLLPKGLMELRKLPKHESIDDNLIKYTYKDKTVSDKFITHNLNIYLASMHLQRLHTGIKFFTKRETSGLSYMPQQPPDAFISLKPPGETGPKRFFLDIIPDTMYRRELEKKIAGYIEFFDEGTWQESAGNIMPKLLLLCESGSGEKRLQKQVARRLYDEELECFTSSQLALVNAYSETSAIWSNVDEPEELFSLGDN